MSYFYGFVAIYLLFMLVFSCFVILEAAFVDFVYWIKQKIKERHINKIFNKGERQQIMSHKKKNSVLREAAGIGAGADIDFKKLLESIEEKAIKEEAEAATEALEAAFEKRWSEIDFKLNS